MFNSSSSGFGLKPATTAPATGTSLFGQPQQNTGTSIFGGNTQNQPATSTSMFGNTSNTGPNTTGSLFGGGGTGAFGQQNQQKPAGTSLFGQSNAGGTGTGLFGQNNQQQQQQSGGTGTGLFGQSNTGGTGTGLFGQTQNQPQQSGAGTGTGLFGQSNTSGTGTGLFGQSNQQQQQGGTGTGLFGQTNAGGMGTGLFGQNNQQQQQGAGNSLFGQSNTGGSGTGLFGQNNQQQQGSTGTGGGLFGQSTTGGAGTGLFGQANSQNTTGGGLFGQSNTGGGLFGQNNQQPGATGLFGQNTGGTGTGLFGQSQQQQPQQQNSLFGGSNAFGANTQQNTSSLFGKPAGQQQPQLSSQQAPPFTKSTKFNDLPDEFKRLFEQIDTHIQGRVQISKELHQRQLGEEATKGQELVRSVHRDLAHTSTTIRNDLQFTRDLKAKADQAVQDTIVTCRIVDGFKNTQANGAYLKDHATFPLEFFTRITRQTKERLAWYKSTIEQIERKLSSMANQPNITPQRIVSALQAQHATFLALAGRTASLDAELQKIKAIYTQLWRTRTGSVRDPFDGGADIEEQGLGPGVKGDSFSMSMLNVR
ncbi:Nucleoporin nup49/NSP49 (Nuclear pore protein nup49/NSP49) [Marasmius crinis-equi]|uniref:Nucleoporin nup49/NSP49 (Nuclear pore protein nup49/NSP49) n=1 Tax=Marasmius crinis-equi TaxID=585013 RepID=A0ABR3FVM7_9AGAR